MVIKIVTFVADIIVAVVVLYFWPSFISGFGSITARAEAYVIYTASVTSTSASRKIQPAITSTCDRT